jgi:flagellar protein FlbD
MVIQLTRLRHDDTFFVNPDLIERVDTHVDTVVRLTTGSELVVAEDAEEILHRIVSYRATIIALSSLIDVSRFSPTSGVVVTADDSDWAPHALEPGQPTDDRTDVVFVADETGLAQ